MIVFCGNQARAKQITQTSPYRQAILNAYYQEAAIIDAVTTLDAKLFKDPGLMNLRVQIFESKQEFKKQPINQKQGQNKSKKQIKIEYKKQVQGKKKSEKKGDKKKPKEKKQKDEKKEEKKEKKEEKKEEHQKKYKLKKDVLVCFAVKDEKQQEEMRKKIINDLEREGISVKVQNFEDMKYFLQSVSQNCILISHASNQLQQLKISGNTLELTISLFDEGKKQEQTGQDGDVFLNSAGEIIQKLKDIDFIE